QQALHPISPETGQEVWLPNEMRLAHGIAALTAPVGGGALEKGLEQIESRNLTGAAGTLIGNAIPIILGGKLMAGGEAKPPATSTEALATFVDNRGGAIDSHALATDIKPLLDRQAKLDSLNVNKLEGREVGRKV